MWDNRYLSSKDAFFVEDVVTDVSEFQEKNDSYRVLLFPPLSSYQRLLIHKTVESDFPTLITFSLGAQDARRTVVAFREACQRGEKGRELLSKPPELKTDSQKQSQWNSLSSSERVANWVKQREARRLNKERWSKRTEETSDVDISHQCVHEEVRNISDNHSQAMDKSKSKKQAVPIYVPPSMRQKKAEEMEDSASVGKEPSCETVMAKDFDSQNSDANSASKRRKETESLPDKKDSPLAERKAPRGRGRGRRKPEMEVYVPRALRAAQQDVKAKSDASGGGVRDKNNVHSEKDVCKNDMVVDKERVAMDIRERFEDVQEQRDGSQSVSLPDSEISDISFSENNTNSSNSNNVHQDLQDSGISSETSSLQIHANDSNAATSFEGDTTETSSVQIHANDSNAATSFEGDTTETSSLQIHANDSNAATSFEGDTTETSSLQIHANDSSAATSFEGDTTEVHPLTFEFYDPAVIAFLPSPKNDMGNPDNFSCVEEAQLLQQTCDSNSSSIGVVESMPEDAIPTHATHIDDARDSASPCVQQEWRELSESQDHGELDSRPAKDVHSDKAMAVSTHAGVEKKKKVDRISKKKKTDGSSKQKKVNRISEERKVDRISKEEKGDKSDRKAASAKGRHDVKGKLEEHENVDDEAEEDSWDAIFDDNGDCLDDSMIKELTDHVGKVEIDKPKISYLNYTPKEPDYDMRAFGHIVEIYDFPAELATHDLITAFRDFSSRGFDIKWVDDIHALGVFSSTVAANEALKMIHPMFKVRPMSEASKKGQSKAKHCAEFLQPYKERPATTSMAARRLVAGALGMTAVVPKEVRDQERKKLKDAKEKRRRDRQQKNDIWDGNFGSCAMDAEDDRH